jgi:hypothetical protein
MIITSRRAMTSSLGGDTMLRSGFDVRENPRLYALIARSPEILSVPPFGSPPAPPAPPLAGVVVQDPDGDPVRSLR